MTNPFYWLTALMLRGGFRLLYRFRIYGAEHLPPGSAILAPNHNSLMDPPLMMGVTWPEEVHFLAHINLFKPVFRWFLKGFNAHPTRNMQSFRILQSLMAKGKKIVVFPEGGISRSGEFTPFHTGPARLALRARCPIIPVYLAGTFDAWPRQNYIPRFGHKITCVFGQPIFVDSYLGLEPQQARDALTEHIRQSFENLKSWLDNGAQGTPP